MKRLRDKIKIEPLDELRLAKIERQIIGAMREHSIDTPSLRGQLNPWVAAFAGAAAMALIAAGGWLALGEHAPQEAVAIAPITLTTGAGQDHIANLGDAVVALGSDTEVTIHRLPTGEISVNLVRGLIECEVEPKEDRPPFEVVARDVTVTVVGTVFSVEHRKQVRVSVSRGKVLVRRGEDQVYLGAGDSWGHSGVMAAADKGGTNVPTTEHAVDPVAPDNEVVAEGPIGPSGGHKKNKPSRRDAAPEDSVTKTAEPVALSKPPPGLLPLLSTEATTTAERIDEYRSIIRRNASSTTAAHALYSIAYLQLYRERKPKAALRTILLFEQRFRSDLHSESVHWLRIAMLCQHDHVRACRGAASSYSRRYPSGHFADQVRRLLNR